MLGASLIASGLVYTNKIEGVGKCLDNEKSWGASQIEKIKAKIWERFSIFAHGANAILIESGYHGS